ncbi:MAG: TIGR02757 family protein [Bacteroidales bacterium]|nr:TIGR02757 family protein [Bacteroidales bacterium]
MTNERLYEFLEHKYRLYNTIRFIETDPISIPHQFTKKEDIEISGFLSATIAWGQRKTIINNGNKIIQLMEMAPYDFIINHEVGDLNRFDNIKHRTFNSEDLRYFIKSLKNIYKNHQGLEGVFSTQINSESEDVKMSLTYFKEIFFEIPHPDRTKKHVSDPGKGSAAKRINMFLRWMARNDQTGVDFGLWNKISPSQLICPLDVHSGTNARDLGLLNRKQNDWKAAKELTENLKAFDATDPVKYDFALFGLGALEDF